MTCANFKSLPFTVWEEFLGQSSIYMFYLVFFITDNLVIHFFSIRASQSMGFDQPDRECSYYYWGRVSLGLIQGMGLTSSQIFDFGMTK